MRVVDHAPHAWFLFQKNDELFLDVNCNHSSAGYSILIRLNEEEAAQHAREGRPHLDRLAQAVQDSGPGSDLQRRDVGNAHRNETHHAVLKWRGEEEASEPLFITRPTTLADVPALARLHVQTFNESHGPGPSVETREAQWRQKLADDKGFCFVAIDPQRELVGFANGNPYELDDLPYDGRLEKIYVLRAWHRQGIGRRLMSEVADTFLKQGIQSMLLFSEANNP
ncbi:MAG: GNAT family N-acetyltransferase [Chlorobia bacterium]|nr:GNAT family N-acetyltransferase [Fimbriimonadaceae bacterium]